MGRDTNVFEVISFYSSTIFEEVGYTATEALYASLGYGAVQVIFTIPTLFLIDTKGRRTLTLIVRLQYYHGSLARFLILTGLLQTFPLMCIFLLAAGLSLLNTEGSRAAQIGPVVL